MHARSYSFDGVELYLDSNSYKIALTMSLEVRQNDRPSVFSCFLTVFFVIKMI